MKNLTIILFLFFIASPVFSQKLNESVVVSKNLTITKLSENAYIHISTKETEKWGPITANGLIIINNKKAVLLDTPWNNEQTETLLNFIEDSMKVKVVSLVPNHWHEDCMGGLTAIKKRNIKSYANQMTIDIAKEKGIDTPDHGFTDSLKLKLGRKTIECYYLGAAHALDNIVVWIPSEQILFAGCVLKGLDYRSIGFTGDGDINEYPKTLKKLLVKFPDTKTVIPGHGDYGGIDVIHHNISLLEN